MPAKPSRWLNLTMLRTVVAEDLAHEIGTPPLWRVENGWAAGARPLRRERRAAVQAPAAAAASGLNPPELWTVVATLSGPNQ